MRACELDTRYLVVSKDGKLVLQRKKFKDEMLAATKADEFNSDERGTLKFSRDSEKRISGFEINAGRVRHLRFSKEPASNRNQ